MSALVALSLFYTNEPVVNMRENPTHESKVVSQTYFAEEVKITNDGSHWVNIITQDGYSGWVESHQLTKPRERYVTDLKTSRLTAHIYYGVKDTELGPFKSLPYGSELKSLDKTDPRWILIELPDGIQCYIQKGDVAIEPELKEKVDLVPFSKKFLGLPYTWGGRSSFGYDCSGFVQMLYNQIGIHLPRDSKMQIDDPRFKKVTIKTLQPGDLLFFGKSEKQINHVGMYMGDGEFIHSVVQENQPWIRISSLDDMEWSGGHPDAVYPYRTFRQIIN